MSGKNIYRNVLSIGGYSYTYTIIQFLASIVIARLLLPAEYGIVAMVTVFTGFISFFKDAGISYYIIREDYGLFFHRSAQGLSILIGVLLSGLVILLAYPIALFYGEMRLFLPTIVMAIVLFIEAITIVPTALISKSMLFSNIGRINFISYTVGSTGTIILAFLGFSYWSLVIGQFISVSMIYILTQKVSKLGLGILKMRNIRVAWQKTSGMIGNISSSRFIQYWSKNTDGLIIGKFYGPFSIGYYNRGYQLLSMQLNLITGIFNAVMLPDLKLKKQQSVELLENAFYEALSLMSIIILPISVALILFSEPIVLVIFGDDWLNVAHVTPYFGIAGVTFVLSRTFGTIYVLFNKENLLFRLGIFSSIVSIVFIAIGAAISVPAVALAFSFSTVAIELPVILYVLFIRSVKFSKKRLLFFWGPKIILSLIILFSLYFSFKYILLTCVVLLCLHVLWSGKIHLVRAVKLVFHG